jgi:hypothetical protein
VTWELLVALKTRPRTRRCSFSLRRLAISSLTFIRIKDFPRPRIRRGPRPLTAYSTLMARF